MKPEMVIPESAHSAYDKAAQYLKIKLWRVPVNEDFQANVKVIQRYLNKNTVMSVGSAPGFPHGIIDPIEELGDLALRWGICFHVYIVGRPDMTVIAFGSDKLDIFKVNDVLSIQG